LWDAGIANFNLIYLSSIIPPGAELCREQPPALGPEHWGDRLYVGLAQQREAEIGSEGWAGIGWVQDKDTRRGLFVEHRGNSKHHVEAQIEQSLLSLCSYRKGDWGDIDALTIGMTCETQPVCAVAAAVYVAEGWS
jgi:arginine decarboxylase